MSSPVKTMFTWRGALARNVCFTVMVCALSAVRCEAEPPHEPVSMVALIAQPEKYDGALVSVTGYAVFEWESSMLYLGQYDAQEHIFINGLWLDTNKSDKAKAKYWETFFNHETVTVEGTFQYPWKDKSIFGTGYPNGIITNVTDIRLQRDYQRRTPRSR